MTASTTDRWPGFYGKIPSLGDFVSRRLPRSFVDPWETWLREAIASSREQLGDQWLDNYLISPLWRFALSPGICGNDAWVGIVMPSVDRVGRYYPLTLVTRVAAADNLFLLIERSEEWFARMESLALYSLDADFQIDELERQLRSLSFPCGDGAPDPAPDPDTATGNMLNNAWHTDLDSQSSVRALYPMLLPQVLKRLLFAYSIWWTQGSERVAPSLLLCQGLPPINGSVALIDGRWQHHGWEEIVSGTFSPALPADGNGDR